MNTQPEPQPKPRVFVGSSREGRAIAEQLQLGMEDELEITLWWQGPFGLSKGPLESLDRAIREFEFAILVLTPDDLSYKRGKELKTPRDNVLFELGLFMGALGRDRTFVVCAPDDSLELPSDFAGFTTATFICRQDGNLQAALGPVCTRLKGEIRRLAGLKPGDATGSRKGTGKKLHIERRRRRRSLGFAHTIGPKNMLKIVDISASGALLETQGEILHDHLLTLDLDLEAGYVARVTARVVRVQYPEWGKVGGVGVRFTSFDGNAEQVIRKYVNEDMAPH